MLLLTFKRLCKKPLPALAVLLFAGIMSVILCSLHRANERELENYEEAYRTIPVTLQICNLTGTGFDDLELPSWAVDPFTREIGVIHSLVGYIKDVQLKMSLKMDSNTSVEIGGEQVGITELVGLTSVEMDNRINQASGCEITWFDGYDETVLSGDEFVCVIPEALLPSEEEDAVLKVSMRYEISTLEKKYGYYKGTFQVVGTQNADDTAVFLSYSAIRRIYSGSVKPISVDAVRATVIDNRQLDEIREEASYWYAEPDLTGKRTPWDYALYSYYPYALKVDDSQLVAAASAMETSILINQLCTLAVFVLSAAASFLIGFLMIRQRKREIALMRTMGTPEAKIYLGFALEQMLCVILGAAIGGAYFRWIPIERLAVFAVVFFVGLNVALMVFLRSRLLTAIKEEE